MKEALLVMKDIILGVLAAAAVLTGFGGLVFAIAYGSYRLDVLGLPMPFGLLLILGGILGVVCAVSHAFEKAKKRRYSEVQKVIRWRPLVD